MKSLHTVEKLGGTSMADMAAVLENVVRPGLDRRRIFVVSAFGGVTDRLLENKRSGAPGVFALFASAEGRAAGAWREALDVVQTDLCRRNGELLQASSDRAAADDFVRHRIDGARSCLEDLRRLTTHGHFRLEDQLTAVREMLASIGEAHSAFVFARVLAGEGIGAQFVDLTGWEDEAFLSMDARIERALGEIDFDKGPPILTGYAKHEAGLLAAFGRGYTEVTFSRTAVLSRAAEGVIHKEFHLSSADPRIVNAKSVRAISRTNYDVADQLANLGMEAIHPRAAAGMRRAGISLRVRNTFAPDDPGARIDGGYKPRFPGVDIVAGIAAVTALELFEQDMVGVKGYDAAILQALTRHHVRIVSKASNANTITHYVEASPKSLKRVVRDLEKEFPTATITTAPLSIVAVIGADLAEPGITARAAAALTEAGVEIVGMQQVTRGVDIQFIVRRGAYEDAVRALHAHLVEHADWSGARSAA